MVVEGGGCFDYGDFLVVEVVRVVLIVMVVEGVLVVEFVKVVLVVLVMKGVWLCCVCFVSAGCVYTSTIKKTKKKQRRKVAFGI